VVARGYGQPERGGAREAEEGAVREREPRQLRRGLLVPRRGAPPPADGGEADTVGVGREAPEDSGRDPRREARRPRRHGRRLLACRHGNVRA